MTRIEDDLDAEQVDAARAFPTDQRYVRACAAALRDRTLTVYDITSVCPECREYVDSSDPAHITAPAGIVDGIAVLIGCEGYHVIDPGRVGLDNTGWEDWRPLDERGPDVSEDLGRCEHQYPRIGKRCQATATVVIPPREGRWNTEEDMHYCAQHAATRDDER